MSRTPMREAVARLAHDRLIDRAERGYVVRERSAGEVQAVYEARIPLVGSAASLAARRRGAIDVDRLDFHVALRDAARSPVITSTLGQLDDMLTDYRPDRTPSPITERGLERMRDLRIATHVRRTR